jgi:hypothetical protein
MKLFWHCVPELARDRGGNTVIAFALSLPVLIGAVGAAIDYGLATRLKGALQSAADAGALAGATELTLGGARTSAVVAIAKRVSEGNLDPVTRSSAAVSVTLTDGGFGVRVVVTQQARSFFGGITGAGPSDVSVLAVAKVNSTPKKICVLGLHPDSSSTVSLKGHSKLTANDCGVYSNSRDKAGLVSEGGSLIKAQLTCSGGGKVGGESNYAPKPILDCPPVKDPLASRPPPSVGPCKATSLVIKGSSETLTPGTYCGGLTVGAGGSVKLMPGVYAFKNGPLLVQANGTLTGEDVGLFFTGASSTLTFTGAAKVSLSAPKDGPMAGLLIFEDRNNPIDGNFAISSNFTRKLLGTIYIPRGNFIVHANDRVADQSAYTVIVAKRIKLHSGPNLVVNSNYERSDVPVPPGLGPVGNKVHLRQ